MKPGEEMSRTLGNSNCFQPVVNGLVQKLVALWISPKYQVDISAFDLGVLINATGIYRRSATDYKLNTKINQDMIRRRRHLKKPFDVIRFELSFPCLAV